MAWRRRLPLATSRPPAWTLKANAPPAAGGEGEDQFGAGPDRGQELGVADLPAAGRAGRRSAKTMARSSRTTPGTIGRPGKVAGKRRMVRRARSRTNSAAAMRDRSSRAPQAGRAAACPCRCAAGASTSTSGRGRKTDRCARAERPERLPVQPGATTKARRAVPRVPLAFRAGRRPHPAPPGSRRPGG